MRSNRLSYRPPDDGILARYRAYSGPGASVNRESTSESLPALGQRELDAAHEVREEVVQERTDQVHDRAEHHHHQPDHEQAREEPARVDRPRAPVVLRGAEAPHEVLDRVHDADRVQELVDDEQPDPE